MLTTLVFTNLELLVPALQGPDTKHPYKTIMTEVEEGGEEQQTENFVPHIPPGPQPALQLRKYDVMLFYL